MNDGRKNALAAALALSNMGQPFPPFEREEPSWVEAIYSVGRAAMEEPGWEDILLEETADWRAKLIPLDDATILRNWPHAASYVENANG